MSNLIGVFKVGEATYCCLKVGSSASVMPVGEYNEIVANIRLNEVGEAGIGKYANQVA